VTIKTTTRRRLSVSHAFTVPVVRETVPQPLGPRC
jgi:hypothetical protein